ncbi:MAG TPA: hypothetical protein VHW23_20910 [Kofleriaceae bacterium]|jgi:hypothetical protein|nr:hypothetical protein [Kofleriaceae bacterium]
MMNQTMFKKISMTLGLVCVAGFASDAPLHAAPRRTATAAAANQTAQIPQRNAGYGGVTTIGDRSLPGVSGDSVPYHLRGSVVYEPTGFTPAPRTLGIALKEIHIFGWFDSSGHQPYPCGKFSINAKHVTVNGREFSGNLVIEPSITPQGWAVSSWVARFRGPTYPNVPHGSTVAIHADVAYSGACIPIGNRSLDTSVVIR